VPKLQKFRKDALQLEQLDQPSADKHRTESWRLRSFGLRGSLLRTAQTLVQTGKISIS